MSEAVVTPAAPAPANVKESPEFKEALAAERERMRLDFDAEYLRKKKEFEATHQPPPAPTQKPDYFEAWGERYGLPADAGRELVEGAVSYVQGQLLPAVLKPLTESSKRQELRSQRAELRASKPKLAALDDRFHGEVMKLLGDMAPQLIGADSYARALHMVIGQHIETLEEERGKAGRETAEAEREPAPGAEPIPASGPTQARKATLNAKQRQFCDEKGFSDEEFVEMMRGRARKMEGNGLPKVEVRKRLGDLLGDIEF